MRIRIRKKQETPPRDFITFEELHCNVEVLGEEGLMALPHGDVYGDAMG